MRRRVIILSAVLLLGLAVLIILPGCFQTEEIICCLGTDSWPRDWYGRAPLTVCMRASINVNGVCTWDFGDGATDVGETVTHTYTEVGIYELVLDVVYPRTGKVAGLTESVVVAGDPVAAFTYEVYQRPSVASWFSWLPSWMTVNQAPEEEDESVEIEFDASSSYPTTTTLKYGPAQLDWGFGDGTQETVPASNAVSWWPWATNTSMIVRHVYTTPGIYTVTMTLTDNLGYSDTVTQTITVGTPGDDDDEDEVLVEDFGLGAIYWELDDEEEEDCIYIDGTVQNNASVAAGVELTATAYTAIGTPVGTFTYWPVGSTNIGVGVDYAYSFFLCDLSVPGEQVVDVEVVVTDAIVH